MSKDTRNVPALRFKGFSDAWEKRKFGELYSKTSEKNDGSFGPDKIISVATMSWKTNVRISNEGYLATYNVLRKGDIAFEGNRSKKFSFGRFVENDIGDGIVSHVFVVFRPKVPPVISYWKYFIHNEFVMRNILRKSTIKATMMTNLSSHDFLRQTLCTPSFKEQENIGNFLERLDSLIAATQDKLEKLSVLQRGFLQHFFAQTWRFSGYSHAWENYRLGDVSTRVRGNDGRMNLPILTISAGKGWLTQEQRFSQNIAGNELKKYTLLSKGELSYNHGNSKLAEYGAVFVLKQFKEALVPRVYHSFNISGKADPDFIEYLFESGVPNHELRKLISSGARMDGLLNINYDSFMNISVRLPSIEEQNKIARVLEKLKKLTDETRLRLFNLQQAKKSLLRMLFP
ncbi:restriction endonuclease subunit S [Lacticaseibacillus rhamnosus]|uniref:restriction endonuclease subunit S n=4 Tax=Lacticaseibacillus rhamnosus TaxID=47715 RepID=UPI001C1E5364|nr:restriction endonuclease subunit S [Lacticaseibacillus rhamnosus]MBU5978085.1 restriction endonuclease subunit S [Lacticaseibacillus rhamnosus]